MTKKLPISDSDRSRASRRVDEHFDFTEFLLANPDILEMLPDRVELELGRSQSYGIWLSLPSVLKSQSGTVTSGASVAARVTSVSGTHVEGTGNDRSPGTTLASSPQVIR